MKREQERPSFLLSLHPLRLSHRIINFSTFSICSIILSSILSQVLLINFPSLGSMSAGENFKFIFREAKINDAILFFDECEAIFETREKGTHDVNMLLTEIERFVHEGAFSSMYTYIFLPGMMASL